MNYQEVKIHNTEQYFSFSIVCHTPEQAETVKSQFPKFCGVHVCQLQSYDMDAHVSTLYHMATAQVDLRPNKVTGAVNETGLKRRDRIVAILNTITGDSK